MPYAKYVHDPVFAYSSCLSDLAWLDPSMTCGYDDVDCNTVQVFACINQACAVCRHCWVREPRWCWKDSVCCQPRLRSRVSVSNMTMWTLLCEKSCRSELECLPILGCSKTTHVFSPDVCPSCSAAMEGIFIHIRLFTPLYKYMGNGLVSAACCRSALCLVNRTMSNLHLTLF